MTGCVELEVIVLEEVVGVVLVVEEVVMTIGVVLVVEVVGTTIGVVDVVEVVEVVVVVVFDVVVPMINEICFCNVLLETWDQS